MNQLRALFRLIVIARERITSEQLGTEGPPPVAEFDNVHPNHRETVVALAQHIWDQDLENVLASAFWYVLKQNGAEVEEDDRKILEALQHDENDKIFYPAEELLNVATEEIEEYSNVAEALQAIRQALDIQASFIQNRRKRADEIGFAHGPGAAQAFLAETSFTKRD